MIKARFLLYFILLNWIHIIHAQNQELRFTHITDLDGLSNPNVNWITQDSKGFMWFGTIGGLNMYDGYKFKKFLPVDNDSNSISSTFIRTIVPTQDGNLWIGTTSGLDFYDRQKDAFNRYFNPISISKGVNADDIYSISIDKDDNLWLATMAGGLNFFNAKSKIFKEYAYDSTNKASMSSNRVLKVYHDRHERLWIGTWEGILNLFDSKNNKFLRIPIRDKTTGILNTNQIRDILQDKDGVIWIATSGSGLYKMIEELNGNYSFVNYCNDPKNPNSISKNLVSRIIEDQHGGLWLGTENGGLNYFSTKGSRFIRYNYDPLNTESLNHNSVWSIFQDNSGNLWVGTFTNGINLNKASQSSFKLFKSMPCNDLSLSYNTVSSFCEDHEGIVWIGTDGGGLDAYNKVTKTFKHFNTGNSNIGNNAVLSVYEDSKRNIWVGTWEGGLNLFDRKSGKFIKYTKENSDLGCNNIITIKEDKRGILWVGTFWGDGGISYLDTKKNKFITFKTNNSEIPDNSVYSIVDGPGNELYLGTGNGLSIFNTNEKTFKNYQNNLKDPHSLSQNTVMCILIAKDSSIWLGTADGLNKFNRSNGTFIRYLIADGLPNTGIVGIEEDNNENLWISTGSGLSRYNYKTGAFRNFDVTDGLQGTSFFRCSHYKAPDGEIYFGGTKGFNVFDPEKIKETKVIPPVYLTGFEIYNQPVKIGAKDSPLQQQITEASKIRLKYDQSVITFDFVALYYSSPEKINYSYKLEGFDKDWNQAKEVRSATYTNLNPGKYVFRVKVPCNNGICNEQGTSIQVIIVPPFWMTLWFKICSIILILLFIFGIFINRVRSINERNRLLEKMVDERTSELKQKNEFMRTQSEVLNETNTLLEERQQRIEEQTEELMAQKEELVRVNNELHDLNATKDKFFSIIAHDIKNPFNTILGFSELMLSNFTKWTDEKKLQIVQIIFSSSQGLFDLLENLLQWSRSQRGLIDFTPVSTTLNQQVNTTILLLKDTAEAKNIHITTDLCQNDIKINGDLRMLDTIFRNLLSNAIKFTYPEGEIKIKTRIEDNLGIFEISDTGMGMSKEVQAKLFRLDSHQSSIGTNEEKGTGLGLILVKEFVSKHGGQIDVISAEGKGSTFIIKFPI